MVSEPDYSASYSLYYEEPINGSYVDPIDCINPCNVTEERSYSRPLGSTSGSLVGYTRVVEYSGTSTTNNGYSVNTFTPPTIAPGSNVFPYNPGANQDFRAGKLWNQYIYSASGTLVKEVNNTYGELKTQTYPAVKVFNHFTNLANFTTYSLCGFTISEYWINSAFNYLKSTSEKTYSSTGDGTFTEVVTDYSYDKITDPTSPHYQLTKQTRSDSRGQVNTEFTYPMDIAAPNTSEQNLLDDHKRNAVLEQKAFLVKDAQSTLLTKQKVNYDDVLPVPKEVFSISQGGLNYEASPDVTYNYYANGNIKEVIPRSGLITAFVWGYTTILPIARAEGVNNATFETAMANAINSLPNYSNGLGDLDNLLNEVAGLDTPAKITKWKDFNDNLRGQSGLISAQISTYTYSPLIGTSSQTDPNGNTTFYEYDDAERLRLIKDHEGNVLSKIEYHYKGR